MALKRKIAVFTSSRADYWLLKPLIDRIYLSKDCELQLFVIAGHLSPFSGHTVDFIETDGLPITAKIETLLASDTNVGLVKSLGITVLGVAEQLNQHKPDLVVVLGDRFEIMAVAQTSYSMKIPVVHIHGGEKTVGAFDDVYRHVITKFSSLHFVSHLNYKQRVVQLGEDASNVFVVGAACLDNIASIKEMKRSDLLAKLKLLKDDKYALFCYHPTTLNSIDVEKSILENSITALLENTDHKIIITKANIDPMGKAMNDMLESYQSQYRNRLLVFDTLGGNLYYNAVAHSEFVIGNSSSGIIEVPYFDKPSVNIGPRQAGRVTPLSVIHCDGSLASIVTAISNASSTEWIEKNVIKATMVYGEVGAVAEKIYEVLSSVKLDGLINKEFVDIKHGK